MLRFQARKLIVVAVVAVLISIPAIHFAVTTNYPVNNYRLKEKEKQTVYQVNNDLADDLRSTPRVHSQRIRSKVVEVGTTVKIPQLEVYVLSAINTLRSSPQVNGRQHKDHTDIIYDVYLTTWIDVRTKGKNVEFFCCFTSTQHLQNVPSVKAALVDYWPNSVNMTVAEFNCQLNDQRLKYVAFARHNCNANVSSFMTLEEPHEANDVIFKSDNPVGNSDDDGDKVVASSSEAKQTLPHLAVCLPAAYGNIPIHILVEWLELQRMLEVSLIYVHYMDLADQALTVLKYYQKQGLVSIRPFLIPSRTGDPPRNLFREHRWDYQAWVDAWVTTSDCRRRLAKFHIVMLLDYDEILLPSPPLTSLRQVFQKALTQHPNAGYFTSESYIHITDWGISYPNSSLYFLHLLDRTFSKSLDSEGIGKSSPKTFFIPTRVKRSDKHSHVSKYGHYTLAEELAKLHHYRSCKTKWGNKCFRWRRVHEQRFLDFQSKWEAAVKSAMTSLKHVFSKTLNNVTGY